MANRKVAYTLGRGRAFIFDENPENILPNIFFPKNPDTAWHVTFMTRHDTQKYGMTRKNMAWHGT